MPVTIPTTVFPAVRDLVISALASPTLQWRRHGIGVVQAYLTESTRLHVWHPSAETVTIDDGMIHDHRFDLTSTVIFGQIENVLVTPRRGDEYRMYEVLHALLGRTDAPVALDGMFSVSTLHLKYPAGSTYSMPARTFHRTIAEPYTVTLVQKYNQEERPARILSRVGHVPVHAFVHGPDDDFCKKVVGEALEKFLPPSR